MRTLCEIGWHSLGSNLVQIVFTFTRVVYVQAVLVGGSNV